MINTHFHLTMIDDTHAWREDIAKLVGKISTVYLYDALKGVNLAELQVSHELTPIYYEIENTLNDEQYELVDAHFSSEEEIYVHVNRVVSYHDFGEEAYDEEDYAKVINDVVESERCNRTSLVQKKSLKI